MTRLVLGTEARLRRTPDGAVWVGSVPDYSFFHRYLDVFDEVRVVARVSEVARVPAGALRVDGPGVHVWPVPYWLGPWGYLRTRDAARRALTGCAGRSDALLLHLPSPLCTLLLGTVGPDRPYAAEVLGDPYDVFAPGVVGHPLRPLLRYGQTATLRRQCRRAAAVAYVSDRQLPGRYPAAPDAYVTACANVDLPEEAFVAAPRPRRPPRAGAPVASLVSVGALDQMYKGVDTVLAALSRLLSGGLSVRLVHVGDGRFRHRLVGLAVRLGVSGRVSFVGEVPAGPAVRAFLDEADVFVFPSRAEALGRALIEAMARGLPAVGSSVGGIPGLLARQDLVPPDDPAALAAAVRSLVVDPARMAEASARNLTRARDFAASVLRPRWAEFHRAVLAGTVPAVGEVGVLRGC